MTNPILEFVRPTKIIEPNDVEKITHPIYSSPIICRKIKDSESLYRNIIAWYLKAAGIKTSDIAKLLSISDSRVNALSNKTRKQLYAGYNSIDICAKVAQHDKKHGEFDETKAKIHMLSAMLSEMQSAEHGLYMSTKADVLFVSKALLIGRNSYTTKFNDAFGTICNCRNCQLGLNETKPYWLEK